MKDNCTDDVIVHLPDDGGKENPINLNGQDEGEVEEQGGCVPQQHLQRFGQGHSMINQALFRVGKVAYI